MTDTHLAGGTEGNAMPDLKYLEVGTLEDKGAFSSQEVLRPYISLLGAPLLETEGIC